MKLNLRVGPVLVMSAAVSFAGCAAHTGGLVPSLTPAATQNQSSVTRPLEPVPVSPDAVPPNCKGQKSTQQYASDKEKLLSKGGNLCIPAFGGLGGSIAYPAVNPPVSISLISSTTNYNHKLPSLGSGSALFYLQIAFTTGTTFANNARAGGGLTGKAITAGSTYTAYAQAIILGFPVNFKPCYTVATKGKYGGVIGGVGTLLKGQAVPNNTSGIIEIYPGQNAPAKC